MKKLLVLMFLSIGVLFANDLTIVSVNKIENNLFGKDKVELTLSNGQKVYIKAYPGKYNRQIKRLKNDKVLELNAHSIKIQKLLFDKTFDRVEM